MAVTLPREGRYQPRSNQFDWEEARRRLEAEPNEWVLPLDKQITNGSVSWLRRTGPIALRDIHDEIEFRMRDSKPTGTGSRAIGTLYARWTPGQKAPEYRAGLLSDEEVRAMREAYATGEVTQSALAEKYGMSNGGINTILHGRSRLAAGGPIIGASK